jgi:hypothetical protein
MRKNNRIPRQKPIKSGKTESGTYWWDIVWSRRVHGPGLTQSTTNCGVSPRFDFSNFCSNQPSQQANHLLHRCYSLVSTSSDVSSLPEYVLPFISRHSIGFFSLLALSSFFFSVQTKARSWSSSLCGWSRRSRRKEKTRR